MRSYSTLLSVFFSIHVFGAPKQDPMYPILFEQCVKSICGEKWDSYKQHYGYVPGADAASEESDRIWHEKKEKLTQEVQAQFDNLIKIESESFLANLPETVLTREEWDRLRSADKVMILTHVAGNKFHSVIGTNSDSGALFLNQAAISSMKTDLKNPQLAEIIEIMISRMWSTLEEEEAFEKTYTKQNADAFFTKLADREKQLVFAIENLPDREREAFSTDKTDMKGKEFSAATKEDLKSQLWSVAQQELMLTLLQPSTLKNNMDRLDFSEISTHILGFPQTTEDVIVLQTTIKEKYKKFIDAKKLEALQEKMQADLVRGFKFLPATVQEKNELEIRATKGLTSALSRIKRLFPEEKKMQEALDTIQLRLPPTQDEYAKRLLFLMHQDMLSFSPREKESPLRKWNSILEALKKADVMGENAEHGEAEIVLPNALKLASIAEEYAIFMRADWVSNTIIINNVLLLYPDPHYGEEILAHEVGHFIEYNKDSLTESGRKKFNALASCLGTLHPEDTSGFDEIQREDFYSRGFGDLSAGRHVSEDFPDFIVAKAYEDQKSINQFCPVFHQPTALTFDRIPPKLVQYLNRPAPLMVENPEGPHSTDFFRLLHVHMVKTNSLPKACTNYLEIFEPNATARNLKSCWQ